MKDDVEKKRRRMRNYRGRWQEREKDEEGEKRQTRDGSKARRRTSVRGRAGVIIGQMK